VLNPLTQQTHLELPTPIRDLTFVVILIPLPLTGMLMKEPDGPEPQVILIHQFISGTMMQVIMAFM